MFWYVLLFVFFIAEPCLATENRDCVVSDWTSWSKCNSMCSLGKMKRSRTIRQHPNWIFAKPCPPLEDDRVCGKENNGCEFFCDKNSANCLCPSGYTLRKDGKTCQDNNECLTNRGLGPCSQICTNLVASYRCSCHKGFKLSSDKHDCIYTLPELCEVTQHLENGKCICNNGLSGLSCNRNGSICQNYTCKKGFVCSSFVNSPQRCVGVEYLLPVLLRIPFNMYMSGNYRFKVDEYVESLILAHLNGNKINLNLLNLRKRRDSVQIPYYVEGASPVNIKMAYTYVRFVVFRSTKVEDFDLQNSNEMCQRLSSTDVNCLNKTDCGILINAGYKCPFIFTPRKNNQKGGNNNNENSNYILIYYVIGVVLVLIVVTLLSVYATKKYRYKKKRNNEENLNFRALYHNESLQRHESETRPRPLHNFDQTIFREQPHNLLYGQKSIEAEDINAAMNQSSEAVYESIDDYDPKKLENKLVVDVNNDVNEPRYTESPLRHDSVNI